jgi:hypothetical protein
MKRILMKSPVGFKASKLFTGIKTTAIGLFGAVMLTTATAGFAYAQKDPDGPKIDFKKPLPGPFENFFSTLAVIILMIATLAGIFFIIFGLIKAGGKNSDGGGKMFLIGVLLALVGAAPLALIGQFTSIAKTLVGI